MATSIDTDHCCPIFIHSLFRAGSTYLFNVFRRSDRGYWCYQEPLHEIALYAQGNHDLLLSEQGEKMALLRHPCIGKPYFHELYDVADFCLEHLKKSAIYDAYFAPVDADSGIDYWKCLIDAAPSRAVLQECRTSSRIGAIKSLLGGFHAYLWRNPFDQWWSCKVADYFDAASQLFINGERHPEIISRLRSEIFFFRYENEDLNAEIEWFRGHRLSPEKSYLVFYILWFLGLQEGSSHADLLINVDRLSDTPEYRKKLEFDFARNGIHGIDFSDCKVPQARYADVDLDFFMRIEDKAHGLLLLSGTPQAEINRLMTMRRDHAPILWSSPLADVDPAGLIRDAERARALVLKEDRRAFAAENLAREQEQRTLAAESRAQEQEQCALAAESRAQEQEQRALAAESRAQEQEQRTLAAESRAHEQEQRALAAESLAHEQEQRALAAETRIQELEQKNHELADNGHHWWRQASALEAERNALRQSWSWRITAPVRWAGGIAIGGATPLKRGANGIVRISIAALHRPVAMLMRAVLRRPSLSYWINQRLARYPALHQYLLGVARKNGVIPDLTIQSADSLYKRTTVSMDIGHLTPRARQIYDDLKAAIEKNREVH